MRVINAATNASTEAIVAIIIVSIAIFFSIHIHSIIFYNNIEYILLKYLHEVFSNSFVASSAASHFATCKVPAFVLTITKGF